MNREEIIRMAREAGCGWAHNGTQPSLVGEEMLERFAALVAAAVHEKYSPIGIVAGGAGERTFMHPSVKYILPIGLQLYARIEVREEDRCRST